MTVIMHVKYSKIAIVKDGMLANLFVVISLFGIIGMIGKITEACLNPQLGIATITFHAMVVAEGEPTFLPYLISYIFGPLLGGVIACYMTKLSMKVEDRKMLNEKRDDSASYS